MVQIVLVDNTHQIDAVLLHTAAMAINQQVVKDLASLWPGISASVGVAPSIGAIPVGAWPVFLVSQLPPGEGGFHGDKHNQPFAKVIASGSDDSWTIDASHEIVEMLVDPSGNRMHASQGIRIDGNAVVDGDGVFQYLVEACDPCEANNFGYQIDGILVSDFITPNYYDSSITPGKTYSFKGNLTRPRELLKGGYISYVQPDGSMNQILWVNPGPPVYYDPNDAFTQAMASGVRSIREAMHVAMGAANDAAKHHARRATGDGPKAVRAMACCSARAEPGREERLRAWYGFSEAAGAESTAFSGRQEAATAAAPQ